LDVITVGTGIIVLAAVAGLLGVIVLMIVLLTSRSRRRLADCEPWYNESSLKHLDDRVELQLSFRAYCTGRPYEWRAGLGGIILQCDFDQPTRLRFRMPDAQATRRRDVRFDLIGRLPQEEPMVIERTMVSQRDADRLQQLLQKRGWRIGNPPIFEVRMDSDGRVSLPGGLPQLVSFLLEAAKTG
jgi:hypothetical protein